MRTEKGIIFRATENIEINKNIPQKYKKIIDEVVNHSKNIIDLIQEGDIVEIIDVLNQEIIYIWDDEMLKVVREDIENGLKIERILTKEQYEQNCYKVVE